MEFYERVSGARFHANYIRPGGVAFDLPLNFLEDVSLFISKFYSRIDEIQEVLSLNRIWSQRLIDIGTVSLNDALDFGFSGVMLRGSGFLWDLRVVDSYDLYNLFKFKIPIGVHGDSYDRYLIRLEEMRESLNIMSQVLQVLQFFSHSDIMSYTSDNLKISPNPRSFFKFLMENLINHFKLFSEGFVVSKEEVYSIVEAPKGEFGIFLVSNDSNLPYRCKIKAPGFLHLQGLDYMSKGVYLADLVTIIGTLDLVFGEIDR